MVRLDRLRPPSSECEIFRVPESLLESMRTYPPLCRLGVSLRVRQLSCIRTNARSIFEAGDPRGHLRRKRPWVAQYTISLSAGCA